jgi:methylmalonyl-CoA carboxyltransferase large subunit
MFITGPSVIKQVTGEIGDDGGARRPRRPDGATLASCTSSPPDDHEAVRLCRGSCELPALEQHSRTRRDYPARLATWAERSPRRSVVPDDPKRPYDVRDVIAPRGRPGDFLEIQSSFAANIVIGFGRITGYTRRHHRQPARGAGRRARHQRLGQGGALRPLLQRLQHPLVTFVDVPGFMPGVQQEYGGIIRHGAKMLFAYSAATVPKLTVVLRKAYGGAYLAMCGKDLGADTSRWPGPRPRSPSWAPRGRSTSSSARRSTRRPTRRPKSRRAELIAEYRTHLRVTLRRGVAAALWTTSSSRARRAPTLPGRSRRS